MTASHFLKLPFIMPAQAQKHITHNEAVKTLDGLIYLAVTAIDVSTPPSLPVEGNRYGISNSPSGNWTGHPLDIAAWQDGAWFYLTPQTGWTVWIEDVQAFKVYNGMDWIDVPRPDLTDIQNLQTLGINAVADTQDRLSVASGATLLSHDGNGHQVKVNKNTASDTASLLYQTGFSGRAEIGLIGDDNFAFKTSSDGSTWQQHMDLSPHYPGVTTQSVRSGKISLAVDSVATIPTPASGGVFMITLTNAFGYPQSHHSGIFVYDCGASLGLSTLVALPGLNNAGTTQLTGTAGPSDKTSLSAQTNAIQIENRFQIERDYSFVFLC